MRNGVSGQASAGMVGSQVQELMVTVQAARVRTVLPTFIKHPHLTDELIHAYTILLHSMIGLIHSNHDYLQLNTLKYTFRHYLAKIRHRNNLQA